MKLSKKISRVCAFLCIVQVCLLSLASVSPQIHAWAFHSEQSAGNDCLDKHSGCSGLPDTAEEDKSQPDLPDDKDEFCPVVLFAQGVILVDGLAIRPHVQLSVVAAIDAEPDTVWTSSFKGEVQARAPPVSWL